ncbi:hypothetical protein BP5796_06989 [Coleophoma crateriformis]|uniref:Ketoreductase domain-containing protein n=1 Tax=Coleophoma crateriformis TaxID=565419 RepID=A0A3D8RQE3_9HELO|nr:hypothetical protein BP5796_06989 [Coleophoma crateriformis]
MATEAFSISRSDLKGPTSSTILITGGSSGIGLQTALLLHSISDANNIIVLDRQPPSSAPKSLISSQRFLFLQCDLASWPSQRAAFAAGAAKFGGIDHVFVNAGIAEYEDQFFKDELDKDALLKEPDRRVIDIDVNAANDTVKLAIHYIRVQRDQKKGGSIVLTASLAGYLASAGAPLYSAAKHALVGLMRALKNDLATLNIAISVVAPGITITPILSGQRPGESLENWAKRFRALGVPINDPDEIATAVVYLMGEGIKANGKGLLIQAGRVADLEAGIAKTRNQWMGGEMLQLFRGGRNAPLFSNKL